MPSAAVSKTGPEGHTEYLLRSLIESAEERNGPSIDRNSEGILLDIDIDGLRYLLVRMPKAVSGRAQLSPREQEIVRMVAQGHPNKVIADYLGISSWTVGTYLRRIFAKTGVGSRAAMVARLMNSKLAAGSREEDVPARKKNAGFEQMDGIPRRPARAQS